MERRETLKRWIGESQCLVFFGGAGISTESGIPDFRSADGLYRQTYQYPPETIVSHDFFTRHTEEFYRFYRERMLWPDAEPNAAHRALARLEREGRLSAVVTQNIDGLHQAAGSRTVLELHGSVHRNHCLSCGRTFDLPYIQQSEGIPRCICGGVIRPDVVLYGEPLEEDVMRRAAAAVAAADTLIVGGTSLAVYPAAGLIDFYRGSRLILINRTATPRDERADLLLRGSLGDILSDGL
ncbi:MAG: NAD-dependent protein deacylase [Clostridiales bacterium]|nr:NAD-dependent protein deacylase [Clostridiales bacterium]